MTVHGSAHRARMRRWLPLAGGLAVFGVVVWRSGTGSLLDGLRVVTPAAVGATLVMGLLATVCCADRWRVVADGFGLPLPLSVAIAAYYRSQFLNSTLPGGILGDAHRAISSGRDGGRPASGVRAVVWERGIGQLVQTAVTLVVLVALPSPVRGATPYVAGGLALLTAIAALAAWGSLGRADNRFVRTLRRLRADTHQLARHWRRLTAASVGTIASHVVIFLIAARTVGVTASTAVLVPMALLTLAAMTIPLSVGGWGPREGVAAWVFGVAGLSAAQGLSVSVGYGILALLATVPGAVVLFVPRWAAARQFAPQGERASGPHRPSVVTRG